MKKQSTVPYSAALDAKGASMCVWGGGGGAAEGGLEVWCKRASMGRASGQEWPRGRTLSWGWGNEAEGVGSGERVRLRAQLSQCRDTLQTPQHA